MICQNINQIDKQVRDLCEIELHHRHANNYWLYKWVPFPLFIAVEKNRSISDKNGSEFFIYNKYYGSLYDTFFEFNNKIVPEYSQTVQAIIYKSELVPEGGQRLKPKKPIRKSPMSPPPMKPRTGPPLAVSGENPGAPAMGLPGGPQDAEIRRLVKKLFT